MLDLVNSALPCRMLAHPPVLPSLSLAAKRRAQQRVHRHERHGLFFQHQLGQTGGCVFGINLFFPVMCEPVRPRSCLAKRHTRSHAAAS